MQIRMLNSRSLHMAINQGGFTLIEIFIAIVLLTVGLLGTAALTTGVVRGNLASKNMTTATAIAQTCLEENRRVGYQAQELYLVVAQIVVLREPRPLFLAGYPSRAP